MAVVLLENEIKTDTLADVKHTQHNQLTRTPTMSISSVHKGGMRCTHRPSDHAHTHHRHVVKHSSPTQYINVKKQVGCGNIHYSVI